MSFESDSTRRQDGGQNNASTAENRAIAASLLKDAEHKSDTGFGVSKETGALAAAALVVAGIAATKFRVAPKLMETELSSARAAAPGVWQAEINGARAAMPAAARELDVPILNMSGTLGHGARATESTSGAAAHAGATETTATVAAGLKEASARAPEATALPAVPAQKTEFARTISETPNPDKLWLTGRFGPEGVWSPIRSFVDLPINAKKQLVNAFRGSEEPFLTRGSIDELVDAVLPSVKKFHPVTDSEQRAAAISARLAELTPKVNQVGAKYMLPEHGLETFDPKTVPGMAIFRPMRGSIALRDSDILGTSGTPVQEFSANIAHEGRHGAQVYTIARGTLKQMGMSKGDLSSTMERGEFTDFLASQLNIRGIDSSYGERLARALQRDQRPITDAEVAYGDRLARSWGSAINGKTQQSFGDAGKYVDETTKLLRHLDQPNGTPEVLARLHSHEVRAAIGANDPASLSIGETIRNATEAKSLTDAHDILARGLQLHADHFNAVRQDVFSRYMGLHEVEAMYAEMRAAIATRRYLSNIEK